MSAALSLSFPAALDILIVIAAALMLAVMAIIGAGNLVDAPAAGR